MKEVAASTVTCVGAICVGTFLITSISPISTLIKVWRKRQRDHFSFSSTTQRCPTIAADVIITIKLIAVETAASVRANGVTTNVITFISALSTLINIWIGRVGGSHYTKVYKPAGYPSVANVRTYTVDHVRSQSVANETVTVIGSWVVHTHLMACCITNVSRKTLVDV